MDSDTDLAQVVCTDCGMAFSLEAVTATCPECGSPLRVSIDDAHLPGNPAALGIEKRSGVARFAPALGVDMDPSRSLGAGDTRPIESPTLSTEIGVEGLWIVDEGRNPTGSAVDREMAVAVATAAGRDAERLILPSTGHAAQSVAAYGGRYGLESLAYLPSRTPFLNKAMTNVHGGELAVVEGRYSDALDAFESDDQNGFPVDPRSPFRQLGAVTLAWDVLAGFDWSAPDAIVLPVGHGHRIVGLAAGLAGLRDSGSIEKVPRLFAVQPGGCAPIVSAFESNRAIESDAKPDTIVGSLEIPAPALGAQALTVLEESGGGAVAVTDDDALAEAVDANGSGIELSATGGVALAGLRSLVDTGGIDAEERVLLVDPLNAAGESDVLRSHLMSRGI